MHLNDHLIFEYQPLFVSLAHIHTNKRRVKPIALKALPWRLCNHRDDNHPRSKISRITTQYITHTTVEWDPPCEFISSQSTVMLPCGCQIRSWVSGVSGHYLEISLNVFGCGGNQSTQRKPTQAWEEHANSTQKVHKSWTKDLVVVRQQR